MSAKGKGAEAECRVCGTSFRFSPSQARKYCSPECYHSFNCGENNGSWRGGQINEPWYDRFIMMKQRCFNPRNKDFHRYGGRGIKLFITCEQVGILWKRDSADLLKNPTIDRIDNDGNYSLENCRFIENSENSRRSELMNRSNRIRKTKQGGQNHGKRNIGKAIGNRGACVAA